MRQKINYDNLTLKNDHVITRSYNPCIERFAPKQKYRFERLSDITSRGVLVAVMKSQSRWTKFSEHVAHLANSSKIVEACVKKVFGANAIRIGGAVVSTAQLERLINESVEKTSKIQFDPDAILCFAGLLGHYLSAVNMIDVKASNEILHEHRIKKVMDRNDVLNLAIADYLEAAVVQSGNLVSSRLKELMNTVQTASSIADALMAGLRVFSYDLLNADNRRLNFIRTFAVLGRMLRERDEYGDDVEYFRSSYEHPDVRALLSNATIIRLALATDDDFGVRFNEHDFLAHCSKLLRALRSSEQSKAINDAQYGSTVKRDHIPGTKTHVLSLTSSINSSAKMDVLSVVRDSSSNDSQLASVYRVGDELSARLPGVPNTLVEELTNALMNLQLVSVEGDPHEPSIEVLDDGTVEGAELLEMALMLAPFSITSDGRVLWQCTLDGTPFAEYSVKGLNIVIMDDPKHVVALYAQQREGEKDAFYENETLHLHQGMFFGYWPLKGIDPATVSITISGMHATDRDIPPIRINPFRGLALPAASQLFAVDTWSRAKILLARLADLAATLPEEFGAMSVYNAVIQAVRNWLSQDLALKGVVERALVELSQHYHKEDGRVSAYDIRMNKHIRSALSYQLVMEMIDAIGEGELLDLRGRLYNKNAVILLTA